MLSVRGDFNDDQLINALDVDLLAADLAAQSHSAAFDLTGDARVDQQDLEYWVVDLYGTLFGDADLNRRVDRGDLARLTRGYGHSARASWADGNFNADDGVGLFDLRLLQANFGRTGPGHTTVDDVVTMVAGGLDRLDQSLPDLVSELNFDLGGPGQGTTLPVAGNNLAELLGLTDVMTDALPRLEGLGSTADQIRSSLLELGFAIELFPGGPEGGAANEELRIRYDDTVENLATTAEFDDATNSTLGGLSSFANFDGVLDYDTDITAHFVFGVDVEGFYLSGTSSIQVETTASGAIGDSFALPLPGLNIDATGTATVHLVATLGFGEPQDRIRSSQLSGGATSALTTDVDGEATVSLNMTLTSESSAGPSPAGSPAAGSPDSAAMFTGLWTMSIVDEAVQLVSQSVTTPSVNDFVHALLPALSIGAGPYLSSQLGGVLDNLLANTHVPLMAEDLATALDLTSVLAGLDVGAAGEIDDYQQWSAAGVEVVYLVDVATFADWLVNGLPADTSDIIRLRVNLDELPLEAIETVQASLGTFLFDTVGVSVGIENAMLGGQMTFGLDTSESGAYLLTDDGSGAPPSHVEADFDVVANLNGKKLSSGIFEFNRARATVSPTVELTVGGGTGGKLRVSDVPQNVTLSLQLTAGAISLFADQATLFPRDDSTNFSASAEGLLGTITLAGAIDLTALRVAANVNDALELTAHGVQFGFDAAAPGDTLARLEDATVEFPGYPDIPSGSIGSLEITRDGSSWRIVLEDLTVMGGDYAFSPEPAAAPAAESTTPEAPVKTAGSLIPGVFEYSVLRASDFQLARVKHYPSVNNIGQISITASDAAGRERLATIDAAGRICNQYVGADVATRPSDEPQIADGSSTVVRENVVSADGVKHRIAVYNLKGEKDPILAAEVTNPEPGRTDILPLATINNNGMVAYVRNNPSGPTLHILPGNRSIALDVDHVQPPLMMSDDGSILIRVRPYDSDQSELRLYRPNASSGSDFDLVASAQSFNGSLSAALSDDGRIVVFHAVLTSSGSASLGFAAGEALFASFKRADGSRNLIRLFGIGDRAAPGLVSSGLASFDPTKRMSVNARGQGADDYLVAFMGRDQMEKKGVFAIALSHFSTSPISGTERYRVDRVTRLAREGDELPAAKVVLMGNAGVGANNCVSSFVGAPSNILLLDLDLGDAVSGNGQVVFWASSSQGDLIVKAQEPRRPIVLIPGIAGSYAKPVLFDLDWLLHRGAPPSQIQIDPLADAYADTIETLQRAGYVEGRDLFIAAYDWRLLPGPIDGFDRLKEEIVGYKNEKLDGRIENLVAGEPAPGQHTITDVADRRNAQGIVERRAFEFGVDYLGYWLRRASESWAERFPGVTQPAADVIMHSTGGVVGRVYVQSAAYGGSFNTTINGSPRTLTLPRFDNFIMMGVPNRGASKPWNALHNNFKADEAYKLVLSKILYRAALALEKGRTIDGPDQIIQPGQFNFGVDPDEDADFRYTNQAEVQRFIEAYVPTGRGLLATYPFLVPRKDGLSQKPSRATAVDVNDDWRQRNNLVLDLNAGLDLNGQHEATRAHSPFVTEVGRTIVIAGTDVETPQYSVEYVGDRPGREFWDELFRLDNFADKNAADGEQWWDDPKEASQGGGPGDGTVPWISSLGQFFAFGSDVDLVPILKNKSRGSGGKSEHLPLMSNLDAQNAILARVGQPLGDALVSTTLQGANPLNLALFTRGLNREHERATRVTVVEKDPVAGFFVDGLGRRLGWSPETGVVAEIPNSFYLGAADGIGYIVGPVIEPLHVELTGLGLEEPYVVQVGTTAPRAGGIRLAGRLDVGETRVESFDFLELFRGIEVGDILEIHRPSLTVNLGVRITDTGVALDSNYTNDVTIRTDSAALFPDLTTEALDGLVTVEDFEGRIDLITGALHLEAGAASVEIDGVLSATAAATPDPANPGEVLPGVEFNFDPRSSDPAAVVGAVRNLTVDVELLDEFSENFGSNLAHINELVIRRNGFSLDGSFGDPTAVLTIGGDTPIVELTGPQVVLDIDVTLTPLIDISGTVSVTAASAQLFPDDSLSGGFGSSLTRPVLTFNIDTDGVTLDVDKLELHLGDLVKVEAERTPTAPLQLDLAAAFADRHAAIFTAPLVKLSTNKLRTASDQPIRVDLHNLTVYGDGFSLGSAELPPSDLLLFDESGDYLEIDDLRVKLTNLVFDTRRAQPFSADEFVLTAAGAALFPDLDTPEIDGVATADGLTLAANFNAGSFTIDANRLTAELTDVFEAEALMVRLDLSPAAEELLSTTTAKLRSPLLKDAAGRTIELTLSNLTLTRSELSLGSVALGPADFVYNDLIELDEFTLQWSSLNFSVTDGFSSGNLVISAVCAAVIPNRATNACDGMLVAQQPTMTADFNAGDIGFTASEISASLGGLLDIAASEFNGKLVEFNISDDPAKPIFSLPVVTARLSALEFNNLAPEAEVTGIELRGDGTFKPIDSIRFTVPAAYTFGIADFLPFAPTVISVTFINGDLNRFDIGIDGQFNMELLQSLLPDGAQPYVVVGDPSAGAGCDPKGVRYIDPAFEGENGLVHLDVAVESLRDGRLGFKGFGPLTIGFADLALGEIVLDACLSLGRFDAGGQLQPLVPGGPQVNGFVAFDFAHNKSSVDPLPGQNLDEIRQTSVSGQPADVSNTTPISLDGGRFALAGTFDTTGSVHTASFDIDANLKLRLRLGELFELYGVGFNFTVGMSNPAGRFDPTFDFRLNNVSVDALRVALGEGSDSLMVFTALGFTDANQVYHPGARMNFYPNDPNLPFVQFGEIRLHFPDICTQTPGSRIGGSVTGLDILRGGIPDLYGIDAFEIQTGGCFSPENKIFSWLPFQVDELGLKLHKQPFSDTNGDGDWDVGEMFIDGIDDDLLFNEGILEIDANNNIIGIGDPTAFSLTFSGGLTQTSIAGDLKFPITATVRDLELDIAALKRITQRIIEGQVSGESFYNEEVPIKNIGGVSIAVDPFSFFPSSPFKVRGGMSFGQVTVNVPGQAQPRRSIYARVFGDFEFSDWGAGIDLVISDHGPLLAKIVCPMAIVLGQTTLVISGVSGGITFGLNELRSVDDPLDLVTDPVFIDPFATDDAAVVAALEDLIRQDGDPKNPLTWSYTLGKSMTLGISGEMTSLAVAGLVRGQVTLVGNIVWPDRFDTGGQPLDYIPDLRLFGTGNIAALGVPLGRAGILLDLENPLVPEISFAIAAPAPGSLLGFLFPARVQFGARLTTSGLPEALMAGMYTFIAGMADGVVQTIAGRLEADHSRPLAQLLLDVSPRDGLVSPQEDETEITGAVLKNRMLALLPTSIETALMTPGHVARATSAFLSEYMNAVGQVDQALAALETLAQSDDPAAINAANDTLLDLGAQGVTHMRALADDMVRATVGALINSAGAVWDGLNPELYITGGLQSTIFGFPIGDPAVRGELLINKRQVTLSMSGSNIGTIQAALHALGGPFALAGEFLLYTSLNLEDRSRFGFTLDLPAAVVTGLLGAGRDLLDENGDPLHVGVDLADLMLDTINPFANWQAEVSGSIFVAGFRLTEATGIMFPPQGVDEHGEPAPTGLAALRIFNLDLDKDEIPDPARLAEMANSPGKIPVAKYSQYVDLMRNGGALLTGQLLLPHVLRDPIGVFNAIDWTPPENTSVQPARPYRQEDFQNNPLLAARAFQDHKTWINDIVTALLQQEEWARLQIYVPSPARLFDLDTYFDPDNPSHSRYLRAYGPDQQLDPALVETHTDTNGNGRYDLGEPFIDKGNGRYDPGEQFTDAGNGVQDADDPFTDLNDNGWYDSGEPFIDRGNGRYDGPEAFVDANENRAFDGGESYSDDNGNGQRDGGESFVDVGNGFFDGSSSDPERLALRHVSEELRLAWMDLVDSFYIEGYVDAELLSVNWGKAFVRMTTHGLEATLDVPQLGLAATLSVGTRNLNVRELLGALVESPLIREIIDGAGGQGLADTIGGLIDAGPWVPNITVPFPIASFQTTIASEKIGQWLETTFGLPAAILSSIGTATATFSAYTPGYADPLTAGEDDRVQVYGGFRFVADANVANILDDADVRIDLEYFPSDLTSANLFLPNFLATIEAQSFSVNSGLPDAPGIIAVEGAQPGTPFRMLLEKRDNDMNGSVRGNITLLPGATEQLELTVEGDLQADLDLPAPALWGDVVLGGSGSLADGDIYRLWGDFHLHLNNAPRVIVRDDREIEIDPGVRLSVNGQFAALGFELDGTVFLTASGSGAGLHANVHTTTLDLGTLGDYRPNSTIDIWPDGLDGKFKLTALGPTNPAFNLRNAALEMSVNTRGGSRTAKIAVTAAQLELYNFDYLLNLPSAEITYDGTTDVFTLIASAPPQQLWTLAPIQSSFDVEIRSNGYFQLSTGIGLDLRFVDGHGIEQFSLGGGAAIMVSRPAGRPATNPNLDFQASLDRPPGHLRVFGVTVFDDFGATLTSQGCLTLNLRYELFGEELGEDVYVDLRKPVAAQLPPTIFDSGNLSNCHGRQIIVQDVPIVDLTSQLYAGAVATENVPGRGLIQVRAAGGYERPDSIGLIAWFGKEPPAGAQVRLHYDVTSDAPRPIHTPLPGEDYVVVASGEVVLTPATNEWWFNVREDETFEFDETLTVDVRIVGVSDVELVAGRLRYTIVNDDSETRGTAVYYDFDTAAGEFTTAHKYVSDVHLVPTPLRLSDEIASANHALVFDGVNDYVYALPSLGTLGSLGSVGFTVRDVKKSGGFITSLADADALLALSPGSPGIASERTTSHSLIDFYDAGGGGSAGRFGVNLAFPNDAPGDDNDFVIRATAAIQIPTPGAWTFATNSDDGMRLRIDGADVRVDDALHGAEDRFGTVTLAAGYHFLELVYFERGGGAEVELFATPGTHTAFNTAFRLVGDVTNGGLNAQATPGLTVRDVKQASGLPGNVSDADALLALWPGHPGIASERTAVHPTINFFDTGGDGHFAGNVPFPNDAPGDDNGFALRATGMVYVPQTAIWTFGTNSDDGLRLRIDDIDVIVDPVGHGPEDRFGARFLTAGFHRLELVYFEWVGGAELELFAAPGLVSVFSESFRLIGDTAGGGLFVLADEGCALAPVGLVSSWAANGVASDEFGDNHGSLVGGATFAAGKVGHAFALDGTNDYVQIPDAANLTPSSLTLEAWVNPDALRSATIVAKYNSGVLGGSSWALSSTPSGNLEFVVYQSAAGPSTVYRGLSTAGPVLSAGTWQHVAATFELATQAIRIYVNGVDRSGALMTGSTSISHIADNATPVLIGALFASGTVTGPALHWDGTIDEVALYDRALTATEIQTIHSAGGGKCAEATAPLALPSDALTIEFWMNPTAVTGFDHPIALGGGHQATVYLTGGNLIQYKFNNIGAGAGSRIEGRIGNYTFNQWQHVAVTYDGLSVKGYLNGVLGSSTAVSGPIQYVANSLFMGATDAVSDSAFAGSLDEVRIWGRALSQPEIQANLAQPRQGREPGLYSYWRFNEGQGTVSEDVTGHGRQAVLGPAMSGRNPTWSSAGAPVSVGSPAAVFGSSNGLPEIQPDTFPPVNQSQTATWDSWPSGGRSSVLRQLLFNPSGEFELANGEILGWSMQSGVWSRRTANPTPDAGTAYFAAGASPAELSQTVDVREFAGDIDAGRQRFAFSGAVRSLAEAAPDVARVYVEYFATDGMTVLSSFDSGEVTNTSYWQPVADTRTAPVGTRSIRVRLVGVLNTGPTTDAFFDDLRLDALDPGQFYEFSFRLDGGPPAMPDDIRITLTGLRFFDQAFNDGPAQWELYSSRDSYSAPLGAAAGHMNDFDRNEIALGNEFACLRPDQTPIAFRLYGYGAEVWQIDDLALIGYTHTSEGCNTPPTAVDDNVETSKGAVVTIGVLANDFDLDGDPISLTRFAAVSAGGGSVNHIGGGVLRYTPVSTFVGTDSFTYEISDDQGDSDAATVTIVVVAPPQAMPDGAQTQEDVPVVIPNVLANDIDPAAGGLSIVSFTQGSRGAVGQQGAGFVYTPNPNQNGGDSFTYTVRDRRGVTAVGTVSISIAPVNDRPTAVDRVIAVNEDGVIPIGLFGSDVETASGNLTFQIVSGASHGTAELGGGSLASYRPAANYHGPDSFTYRVIDRGDPDGSGAGVLTGNATVTITVTPTADPPLALNPVRTVAAGELLIIPVSALGTDADGDNVTIVSVGAPTRGSVTSTSTAISYRASTVIGAASFGYSISDGTTTTSGTVIVNVLPNQPPVARAEAIPWTVYGPFDLLGKGGNLDGQASSDVDSPTLTYSWAYNGGTGNLSWVAPLSNPKSSTAGYRIRRAVSGSSPPVGTYFNFTLTVSDAINSSQVTVSVVVVANASDPPFCPAGCFPGVTTAPSPGEILPASAPAAVIVAAHVPAHDVDSPRSIDAAPRLRGTLVDRLIYRGGSNRAIEAIDLVMTHAETLNASRNRFPIRRRDAFPDENVAAALIIGDAP